MKIETESAYKEILDVLNKHKDVVAYDYAELETKSKHHLFGLDLKETYGLDLEPKDVHSLDYLRYKEYMAVLWMGEKYRRTVSWSDDGKQPDDELMLSICFPTGAYIFGSSWGDDDYPLELFQEFFQELKSHNPKFVDTTNHCLYFSIENASTIFNTFSEIMSKYHEKNKVDSKKRKIEKLQKEIEKLTP